MEYVAGYKLEGIDNTVHRVRFGDRVVEFWYSGTPTSNVLIAHDGQCIFDRAVAKAETTWELAQTATKVSANLGIEPPVIIAIWHQGKVGDSVARGLDLSPDEYFKSGIELFPKNGPFDVGAIRGDEYLHNIFNLYVPAILNSIGIESSPRDIAMIGASRGGLSTLYALRKHSHQFETALVHSTHWPIGREALVKLTIDGVADPGRHAIWMAHGTEGFDSEYGSYQDLANTLLKNRGYVFGEDALFTIYPSHAHTEADWAVQAADSLKFWLEKIS